MGGFFSRLFGGYARAPGISVEEMQRRTAEFERRNAELEKLLRDADALNAKLKTTPNPCTALSAAELQTLRSRIGLKTEHYNVGFCGMSGKGKSSLINAILKEEVAVSGVTETTMVAAAYDMPGSLVTLWDLPGAGTEKFPAATYVDQFGLRAFDAIVLVTDRSFFEFDVALYGILVKSNVPVLLLRTKIDAAVLAESRRLKWNDQTPMNDVLALCREIRTKITAYAIETFPKDTPPPNLYILSAHAMSYAPVYPFPAIQFDEDRFGIDLMSVACRRASP